MQGVVSLGHETGAGLFAEVRPRGTTPRVGNHYIGAHGLEARGDTTEAHCQEAQGMMLPLASLSLTPNYDDELWTSPVHGSVSVSPLIGDAYNGYNAGHVPYQGEGK